MKRRNKVYVAGKGNYNNYYIFDLKSDKLDFLFYSSALSHIKFMKIKPRFAKKMKTGSSPFIIRENEIWSGASQVRYIGLNTKKIFSQYIFGIRHYSDKISIFQHSDGRSIWAIGKWAIYKITPPEIIEKNILSKNDKEVKVK